MDTSVITKSVMNRSDYMIIDFKRRDEENKDDTGYEAEISYTGGSVNMLEKTWIARN
ncbi:MULTISPECIES: hypothetical protein [Cellulophaga]|uniref:hypothetical protein n=1 Tax=Cellulophaga TaxID=104264 RepID=UPI0020919934|nr:MULTISPECIES: hypothetical protein [Cellulophaga]MDO6769507.1 hypothetical protein [Cellulophaga sp. 1_MG-2023]